MIRVKFFGVLSLNMGISALSIEASRVSDLLEKIADASQAECKDLKKCAIYVAGKPATLQTLLHDDDEVIFLSPAGGG